MARSIHVHVHLDGGSFMATVAELTVLLASLATTLANLAAFLQTGVILPADSDAIKIQLEQLNAAATALLPPTP